LLKYFYNAEQHKIPKGCVLVLQQQSILNDSKYWEHPNVFNPKRFLDSNLRLDITKTNITAFIPFSTGKRMCIGDKFALNLLFLVLTRLLQATNGYHFRLSKKFNNDLEPKTFEFFAEPKTYSVYLCKD
jgi:cytochrome P450